MSVCLAAEGVAHGTQLHVGNVFEPECRAVGIGTYHDVLKLGDFLQTTLVLEGVLVVVLDTVSVVAVHRLLTKLSGRRLKVLLGQCRRDVVGHHIVLSHQLGFHPDTQRVRAAQQRHVAYAFHTLDLRDDVDVQIIGDEVNVVFVVFAAK